MKIKVAVFGRYDNIAKMKTLSSEIQDVEVTPFEYTCEEDTVHLFDKAFMCDIYLFTEPISYLYVKEKIERKRLPAVLVALDEQTVLTSLYQLKQENNQNINGLSIDILNQKYIATVLQDLKLSNRNVYIYDYGEDSNPEMEHIVDYHHNLWKDGKVHFALTSVKSVEERLIKLGVPVRLMTIPTANMNKALREAVSSVKLNQSMSAQVVTGYLQVKKKASITEERYTDLCNQVYDILSRFCKKNDASFQQTKDDMFAIFGTKPVIDYLTSHYRDFPLLKELKSTLQTPIAFGYGLGLTAKQSEVNAKIAFETSYKNDESYCYIVNERQETIGPIGVKKEFDTSKLYHALIHRARLNNELSYNFIDFIRERNNEPFSSNDIAEFYNVTKRSAERTVNKLLSGEVIKVSGEERPYRKGRPRKLFTLNQ